MNKIKAFAVLALSLSLTSHLAAQRPGSGGDSGGRGGFGGRGGDGGSRGGFSSRAEMADLAVASAVGAVIQEAEAPLAVGEGLTPVLGLVDLMQMEMVSLTPVNSKGRHSF